MSARVRTSEPAWRAPVSQWQAERARGSIQPLETPADRHFNRTCYWLGSALLIAVVVADYLGVF